MTKYSSHKTDKPNTNLFSDGFVKICKLKSIKENNIAKSTKAYNKTNFERQKKVSLAKNCRQVLRNSPREFFWNTSLSYTKWQQRQREKYEIVHYLSFRRVHIKIWDVETTRKMENEWKLMITLRKQLISRLFFNEDRWTLLSYLP